MRRIVRVVLGGIALAALVGDGLRVAAIGTLDTDRETVFRLQPPEGHEAGTQHLHSSLPEAFRDAWSGSHDQKEWLEEVGQASASLRIHVSYPRTWKEKGPLRPKGELLNFQSDYGTGRAVMAFNPAFQSAGVSLPLTGAKLKTLAELLVQSLGGHLQAYGQTRVGARTWIWLQHWMPMPQAGEAVPFDGSLAWTFVSGEGAQFFTVTFYVLHLRGAPDGEVAKHVQRAVPIFAETLTRLRLEQTAGPP